MASLATTNRHPRGEPNGLPNGNGDGHGDGNGIANGLPDGDSKEGPGQGPLPIATVDEDEDPGQGFPAAEVIRREGGLLECVLFVEHCLEVLPQAAAAAANSEEGTEDLDNLQFNLQRCLARVQPLAHELEGQIDIAFI